MLGSVEFLNEKNTRFLEIHFHEVLPHGDQIIEALDAVRLSRKELADIVEGANTGSIIYLRLARWALGLDELTSREFSSTTGFNRIENGTYELVEGMDETV